MFFLLHKYQGLLADKGLAKAVKILIERGANLDLQNEVIDFIFLMFFWWFKCVELIDLLFWWLFFLL